MNHNQLTHPTPAPGRPPMPVERRTSDAVELVEVLDTMRAVLGPPEHMDSPTARAIYLLNQSRLSAAYR